MFKALRNLFRSAPQPRLAAVPEGTRYYLIGDIHGRLDLYSALIDGIEQDDAARPGQKAMSCFWAIWWIAGRTAPEC